MSDTNLQFQQSLDLCRDVFMNKMEDYGLAWRVLRPSSLTDQIFIKANRIRSLEIKKEKKVVDEDRADGYMGIINYSIMALIQLKLGFAETVETDKNYITKLYSNYAKEALELMKRKNHDYDEAWRSMRISSYTDLILMKLYRIKQIENNAGKTKVSEGVDANYLDIINYSVFALIKLSEGQDKA